MPSRRLVIAGLAALALVRPSLADTEGRPKVVASFSILGDLVRAVGGDRIEVSNLVGPDSDIHVFSPTPDDVRRVGQASLVVINGLGLEGWLPRLVQSAGGKARIVVASNGLTPLRAEGASRGRDLDPHAWQSVPNARIYVGNIRDGLIAIDPAGADLYRRNADAYLAQLDALDAELRKSVATIPPDRRKVISGHDAFGYFAHEYGILFIAPQGVSTESDIGAADVAALIRQIRVEKIPAVFIENLSDPRLMRQIAAETGARIGGTLYADALTGEKGDAPTYIDMVRHNIRTLTGALAP